MPRTAHVLVHEYIVNTLSKECRSRHADTIARIREIKTEKDVIHVDDFKFNDIPERLTEYDTVILYGCSRGCCLNKISDVLLRKGFSVAYDIAGTL